MTDSDKHSSLLWYKIDYDHWVFYSPGPSDGCFKTFMPHNLRFAQNKPECLILEIALYQIVKTLKNGHSCWGIYSQNCQQKAQNKKYNRGALPAKS